MSNLRKSSLALAVVAALAFSGAAVAATVTVSPTGALPEGIAYFDVASGTTPVGITPMMSVNVLSSDNIVGRTTGFAIRITLNNGAVFNNLTVANGVALPAGWVTSVVGGYNGTNTAIINFAPPSTNPVPGIVPGDIVDITGANAELGPTTGNILSGLAALQSSGQTVSASLQFFDPVSTNNILTAIPQQLLVSGNPVSVTCAPQNGGSYTNHKEQIDVGANPSQSLFSQYGNINSPSNPASDIPFFNAGQIQIGVNNTLANFGYFTFQPTDQLTTTVSGNFSAFLQAGATVFLTTSSNSYSCGGTTIATGTLTAGGTIATFTYPASALGGAGPGGGYANLCFQVPNGNLVPIAPTTVTQSTTFTRNGITVPGTSCQLDPMKLNGPVVHVYTFNPAGNTTQSSFLRVSDTGPAGGMVTITGIDDAGHPGAGPVTLALAAGQSVQLPSSCLQSGASCPAGVTVTGALGTGTGKWRLTVSGTFPNMVVTSLNRNNNSGTVTNLTNYDVQGKQATWTYYGDNGN
ncbi:MULTISPECIES: hypothetical protein [Metallibacterium]|jgi:hypothetical protein|uniref:hypothetical protein n=1 Tax=Metallibacterium TaxID=1218803 RepID=UPI0026243D50|nr:MULTISPECIES: hypothetical protein [Metallibacterium]MBW8075929.1 hypothetical protein [Metallibacterium scheffleri]